MLLEPARDQKRGRIDGVRKIRILRSGTTGLGSLKIQSIALVSRPGKSARNLRRNRYFS